MLLLLSVNHFQAVKPNLATAGAFGDMCSSQTVVIGPVNHMFVLLHKICRAAHPETAPVEHVGVDRVCLDLLVSQ